MTQQPLTLRWDTLISVPGSSFDFVPVWNFIPDTVNAPEQVFEKDGVRVKVKVKNGKVEGTVERDKKVIPVSGKVDTTVPVTTIKEKTVITKEIKQSWWGKTWQAVKGVIWFLVAILIILATFIIRYAIRNRS